MSDQETIPFMPFHAINEFMRDDYRIDVIRTVLSAQSQLPSEQNEALKSLTRRLVQVPGFRNSAKAPVAKRIKPTVDAFTKSPHLAAVILSAWAEIHPQLRDQVFTLLSERGWEVFPTDANRLEMPGFIPVWPSGEDFDSLSKAYHEKFTDPTAENDDISLMVVWIGMRLPYDSDSEVDNDESGE